MSIAVKQHIIKRFLVLYGAPKSEDQAGFVQEYIDALDGTDPALLAEAANLLRDQHKYPTWPTIGECKEAIREVAERRSLAQQRQAQSRDTNEVRPSPTAESRARVDAMMKDAIANLKISGPPPSKNTTDAKLDWSRPSKSVLGELYRKGQL